MKTLKSKAAFMMAMAMVTSVSSAAFASADMSVVTTSNTTEPKAATAQQVTRTTLEGMATVTQLNGDKQITIKIDEQTIVLNLSGRNPVH